MVESHASQCEDFKLRMLNKINLAPMVRMNTLPFRLLVKSYGADYVFSEEIIDRKFLPCVRVENELLNTIDYVTAREYYLVLRVRKEEKQHFILQIGTNNAETAVKAVQRVLPDIAGVDVNMGCPKKFSTQGGMGSALMRDVQNAKTIMKALVDNFADKISVSCKIRVLGTFEDTLNYVLAMQEAGVHWISIHPRTAAEESRVPARWFMVKRLLETGLLKIPVLGSGDLFSPLCVHKYLSFTGASGVILARGAIHNPRIFLLKSRLLDREVPLIAESSANHGSEDDWRESLVEPAQEEAKPEGEEPGAGGGTAERKRKEGKGEYEEESIEFSLNLVKVYDRRYSRFPMETDIIEQVKDYFKLCIETGNHYQNTKYCIMYMLKTHKHHFDLFKKIHGSKNLSDYAKALEMEHLFEDLDQAYFQHFDGTYYRKNKHIIEAAVEQQLPHLNQDVGKKRDQQAASEVKEESEIIDGETSAKRLKQ